MYLIQIISGFESGVFGPAPVQANQLRRRLRPYAFSGSGSNLLPILASDPDPTKKAAEAETLISSNLLKQ